MTLNTALNPWNELERNLFNFPSSKEDVGTGFLATSDITEDDNSFFIHAELPGVLKADLSITINEGILTIKGEKKSEMEDKKRHTYERSFGSFSRSFHLPEEVLADKISADYEDGVLNLVIPKCEREMPKEIEVSIS